MAAEIVPVDIIDKELTCGLCLSLLREPKDLDCFHTFCFDCLKLYVQEKSTLKCPVCHYITVVPKEGLVILNSNLRLKKMVDNFIKDAGPSSTNTPMEVPMCPDHIGERQHFFCVTCSVSVCHNCLVLKHTKPQHEIRELKEVMEEVEKQRREKNQELKAIERKLTCAKDKAEREVKSRVKQVNAEIKSWETKMNQDIQETYQERIKILQEKLIECNRSATSGMSKFSIEQDDAMPHDMTVLHLEPKQLNSLGYGEIVTSSEKKPVKSVSKKQATSSDMESVTSDNNKQDESVDMEPVTPDEEKYAESADKELKLTLLTEFGSFDDAISVAANQSNLVAVAEQDKEYVNIYLKHGGKYRQQCQLTGLNSSHPNSVAISSHGKFVVSDGSQDVKIFQSPGAYESTLLVDYEYTYNVDAIAITPDDMIVAGYNNVIRVLQFDGTLIKEHKVERGDMKDIASNGKQIAFITGDTVCVIDFVTGTTLWKLSMAYLRGICFEQKSNTLLVSRGLFGTGVIEQYCSTTGHLISSLASGMFYPHGMTVTQDNKLVVTDCRTVKIYNIY